MRNATKKIAKDGTVSYLIRVSAGYDVNGKQIKKPKMYYPLPGMSEKQIEKEVERQVVMFEEKVRNGFALDGNIKFAEYAKRFMDVKEMSPMCRERYNSLLERINPAIGHIRLSKLQPMHLQEFYKDLRTIISNRTKEPLSDKTILHHHRLISSILTQATREQIIPRNIANREFMDAPKVAKKEPTHLDDIQAQHVVSLLLQEDDIRVKTSILLLIYSGIRRGELCGLEWSDIDFKNNVIHIRRASQYISKVGIITKEPKNETSKRSIKLPVGVFNLLTQYKTWQKLERLKNGDRWQHDLILTYVVGGAYKTKTVKNNRIFTTDSGGFISPDTINFWIEKFRETHKLPMFTPHALRHTNITLQIAAGVSVRTIASRAGHAQTSTTTNIYSHAIASADEKAAEAINNILVPKTCKDNSGVL